MKSNHGQSVTQGGNLITKLSRNDEPKAPTRSNCRPCHYNNYNYYDDGKYIVTSGSSTLAVTVQWVTFTPTNLTTLVRFFLYGAT